MAEMTVIPVATHVATYGFFLDGKWLEEGDIVDVRAPYDGALIAHVHQGRREHADAAIAAAVKAFGTTRRLPAFERQRVLRQIATGIHDRKEEFSRTIAMEAGKPIKSARTEVDRAVFIFNIAAEETVRGYGEYLPLDWQQSTAGRWGIVKRFPLGPIAGITPFNFPLNLVAHKVAPAIAAGRSMVLKPAPQTPLTELLLAGVSKLKVGDPLDESSDLGPLIRESDAIRAADWVQEAVRGGSRLLCGGNRIGSLFEPTVLTGTKPNMKVNCQEIFAPVVTVEPYNDFASALKQLNNSAYGLQAGLFTRDAKLVFQAYDELEVGGLIAGDVPTFRIDHMPYGGVKDSGLGREGLRDAIQEMTEPKLLVMNLR